MFCMFGASRTHELPTIRVTDIARYDDMFYVTIPKANTKTNEKNSFVIRGPMLDIVRKYENLRPATATSDRFFLNYQKGRCTVQNIGKGKFYKMPNRIAEYLKLPDAHLYTGKCELSFIKKNAYSSASHFVINQDIHFDGHPQQFMRTPAQT